MSSSRRTPSGAAAADDLAHQPLLSPDLRSTSLQGLAGESSSDPLHVPVNGDTKRGSDTEGMEEKGLSMIGVAINVAKCTVGAGSFSLPYAFKMGGLWATSVGTVLLGAIASHTFCLIADAEKAIVNKDPMRRRLTYPETARACLPGAVILGVNVAEVFIFINMCLTSLMAVCAYCIFISTTMPDVIPHTKPWMYVLALFPICAPLVLLRTFKILAFTSILGDVAVTAGVTATLVYGATKYRLKTDLPSFRIEGIAPALAAVSFLLLSHIVALPMAQSLDKDMLFPRRFHRVIWISIPIITVLNLLFAAFAYMLFGDETKDNIIGNLSTGGVLQAVRVLLCIDLLFTIPMLLSPGREVIEEALFKYGFIRRYGETSRNAIRLTLLLLILAVSFGVISADATNAFGLVVTLCGAISCFSCGLTMPPLLHLGVNGWLKVGLPSFIFHLAVSIIGGVGTITATYFLFADNN